jgi:hypothetical protein
LSSQEKTQSEGIENQVSSDIEIGDASAEVVCQTCSRIFSDAKTLARHVEIAGLSDIESA